jgi:hypothetical protein
MENPNRQLLPSFAAKEEMPTHKLAQRRQIMLLFLYTTNNKKSELFAAFVFKPC